MKRWTMPALALAFCGAMGLAAAASWAGDEPGCSPDKCGAKDSCAACPPEGCGELLAETCYACGKTVAHGAEGATRAEHKGVSLAFCCGDCKAAFEKDKDAVVAKASEDAGKTVTRIFKIYAQISAILATDHTECIDMLAPVLSQTAASAAHLEPKGLDKDKELKAYQAGLTGIAEAAKGLYAQPEKEHTGKAGDDTDSDGVPEHAALSIDAVRDAFAAVSDKLVEYLKTVTNKAVRPEQVFVYNCDMAGHAWVQLSADVANPFMGSKMPKCGTLVKELSSQAPAPKAPPAGTPPAPPAGGC